jgi:hypothetical protein
MEVTKNIIRNKWQKIEIERVPSTFALQRFDSNCQANFYIGINENDNKCILHDLNNVIIDFNGFEKTNLKAFKTNKYLILELIGNDEFSELFLDLSCAIFNNIRDNNIQQKTAEIFKDMILKWSEFFSSKKNHKLGEKELIGLWGEIFVLKSIINYKEYSVNEILESWRGPFDSNRDFQFTTKEIEVKTIKHDGAYINISSEFQLSTEDCVELDLRVIKVRNEDNGSSLRHLIDSTVLLILQNNGRIELFYSALCQKVNLNELNEYDYFGLAVNSDRTYKVNNVDFPKITDKDLLNGISNVKYKIALASIENFIK